MERYSRRNLHQYPQFQKKLVEDRAKILKIDIEGEPTCRHYLLVPEMSQVPLKNIVVEGLVREDECCHYETKFTQSQTLLLPVLFVKWAK